MPKSPTTRQILERVSRDAGANPEDVTPWARDMMDEIRDAYRAARRGSARDAAIWMDSPAGAAAIARIPSETLLDAMTGERDGLRAAMRGA